jgi:hypothetical protein
MMLLVSTSSSLCETQEACMIAQPMCLMASEGPIGEDRLEVSKSFRLET